ncbi:MAG: GspE/PulE family protein, partial [Chroococcales cyanobacterium]
MATQKNVESENTSKDDIGATLQRQLSHTQDQIERIKIIIEGALQNRASDIHLEPTPKGLRIRYRIDGILRAIATLASQESHSIINALKVMCQMDITDSRAPQDGRISTKYHIESQQEQSLNLRVSTLPCVSDLEGGFAEKAVLRLLRQQNTFKTIHELGFSEHSKRLYETWLTQPQGIIVFTGPTGSGKTTTLYTSLQAMDVDSVNIVTVENPVEYIIPGITQTQVNEAAGMTFAAGIRAILRQDPDIIMIGEIRDAETAETAIYAALTGHLVFTTMHTNDAIGAIPRFKELGPDPSLLSDALVGIVAQRLVRKVCPFCAKPYSPTKADLQALNLKPKPENLNGWQKGQGCPKCFDSGYLGREAIIELLDIDDTIQQMIYNNIIYQRQRYLREHNTNSFRIAAIEKVI